MALTLREPYAPVVSVNGSAMAPGTSVRAAIFCFGRLYISKAILSLPMAATRFYSYLQTFSQRPLAP
jgi:hypothetical protein